MTIHNGNDGVPQHAARSTRLWENPAIRTTIQGIAFDVALAVALLIYTATSGDSVDWRLLLASLVKTVLMTAASSYMKRVKPRQSADTTA